VTALSFYGVQLVRDADTTVKHADLVLAQAQHGWQDEAENVRKIIGSAQESAAQGAAFMAEQRAQLQKTSRDSDNQVRSLGLVTRNAETFFSNLDQEINGRVLPDFDRELIATSTAAQFSFESMTKAGDALTFQLNDPEWMQTLHGLNMTAASLASFTGKADSTMGHVDHTFAYYDKKLTTPLGFWRSMVNTVLDVGAKAGSISAGFVK
jgi:hypothetical protein